MAIMIFDETRFDQAIARFDAANAEDPNVEKLDGQDVPKELLYARRMTAWLQTVAPDAPESVQLAARSQHIYRWKIPRADFPTGRDGYLQWRTTLGRFHAETAAKILRDVGYDEVMIANVEKLLRKRQLKTDPDVQLLEDVICLVFLENYFADFAAQFDEDKVIDIVRKTWKNVAKGPCRGARIGVVADGRQSGGKGSGGIGRRTTGRKLMGNRCVPPVSSINQQLQCVINSVIDSIVDHTEI